MTDCLRLWLEFKQRGVLESISRSRVSDYEPGTGFGFSKYLLFFIVMPCVQGRVYANIHLDVFGAHIRHRLKYELPLSFFLSNPIIMQSRKVPSPIKRRNDKRNQLCWPNRDSSSALPFPNACEKKNANNCQRHRCL